MFIHRSEVKQTMSQEFMGGLWKVKFSHDGEQEELRNAWNSLQQGVSGIVLLHLSVVCHGSASTFTK